jgi:aerobic-type carbon monoxide dehydrogenase small subunit (CoxS/CutS family)
MVRIKLNGRVRTTAAVPDTPLLYVLAGEFGLKGPRFGCGLAQCGSCSVLVEGVEARSCVTPISAVEGEAVTTLEGLAAWRGTPGRLHPVQQAMIDEQAPQCGYCYNGMIVKAAELLAKTPDPSPDQIRQHMNGHLCRCGTYPRIVAAISRAAKAMTGRAA